MSPVIDSLDDRCCREIDTITTCGIEAENNANYEDNWISRIVEIEDCIDTIKDNYPDIGEKVEELIEVLLEPIWDSTAEERQIF